MYFVLDWGQLILGRDAPFADWRRGPLGHYSTWTRLLFFTYLAGPSASSFVDYSFASTSEKEQISETYIYNYINAHLKSHQQSRKTIKSDCVTADD